MNELQNILAGKSDRIYRQYVNQSNVLTDPTSPFVRVYDPVGLEVSSGTPIKESTGVYYHPILFSTASTTKEGIYQAYWEGIIGSTFVTSDIPQYFYLTMVPWQITQPDNIINSVRRMIGDTNPECYRISTQDMYYFLYDAVAEVQSEYDMGYTLTIAPTTVTWNTTLYGDAFALFKLKTLILVMESTFNDNLYDGGAVQVGDIKIDVTSILRLRMENLKRLREDYDKLLYSVKMNNISGQVIDTYRTGLIQNSTVEFIVYE